MTYDFCRFGCVNWWLLHGVVHGKFFTFIIHMVAINIQRYFWLRLCCFLDETI